PFLIHHLVDWDLAGDEGHRRRDMRQTLRALRLATGAAARTMGGLCFGHALLPCGFDVCQLVPANSVFLTPTLTLPRQGGGDAVETLQLKIPSPLAGEG